ncbi:MAG TPA: cation-transporting P-type ATPase, partial [Gammaproteobacteria bacterium]
MMPSSGTSEHRQPWHAWDAGSVFAALSSRTEGLTCEQAAARLRQYGLNRLRPGYKRSPLLRFLQQFNNTLIYVLLVAALFSMVLHHWTDAAVILGVVFINAVIGFIQEGKAERALTAIHDILPQSATARRDGQWQELNAQELVPGDVISLQAGDKVPADVRLFYCKNLQVDEAILTGESLPVAKKIASCAINTIQGERNCMAYSGTLVTAGQGHGMVTATGDHTEIGYINELTKKIRTATTPLLQQIGRFNRRLTAVILGLGLLTFAFGMIIRDYDGVEMILAAIGLCVAAIPEGLPAIMTITLAVGVQRMARHNVIIRRLPGVETLGSVTVICTDKTGTLTRNEMTVQMVACGGATFEITGSGYNTSGKIFLGTESVVPANFAVMQEMTRGAVLCNDAVLHGSDEQPNFQGDPTEIALLVLGLKSGLHPLREIEMMPRIDVIPFEPENRYMASLHRDHNGHELIYVKGAPERVLEMCEYQRMPEGDVKLKPAEWHARMEHMAGRGLRLLAIAAKSAEPKSQTLEFETMKSGFSLLGIVGMLDPPREEAIQALRECRDAGIRVKMITGDHAGTAASIGVRIGIGDGKTVLTGAEIDRLNAQQLAEAVKRVDVFARTSPEHKLRLVNLLQAAGKVVAMTGDGVNDAPALRRADIGIAMGRKGTQVAAEASEMVLIDDNFASIVYAVKEGRTVYDNLRKSLLFALPTNGGEALTVMLAILYGIALPVTALQILWVNMVTEVTLTLALAFEPAEAQTMRRPPRAPGESILSGFLLWRIAFVSLFIVAGVFGLFYWHYNHGSSLEHARTIAVNVLVMFHIFYLFNTRYLHASSLHVHVLRNNIYIWITVSVLIVAQLAFTYTPLLQTWLGTAPLSAGDWFSIIVVASSLFFLVEIEKAIQAIVAGAINQRIAK